MAYRIIEKEYSTGKKEYLVETDWTQWWTNKRKWRPLKRLVGCYDSVWKEPCIFPTLEAAEKYVDKISEHVIEEKVVKEYVVKEYDTD